MPEYAAKSITHQINHIIVTKKFPQRLKTATILPILKNNKDLTNLLSYRPISNINIIEKVVEDRVRIQLMEYPEKKHYLH